MSRAFISYRRADCMIQARSLYDGLRHRLSDWSLFQDLDSIPPGADYETMIKDEIGRCDVLLLMIGDDWLDRDPDGRCRIDDQHDVVRLEIKAALERGVRIVPLLVEGAEMPTPDQLPAEIARIVRFNAFELSDRRWPRDIDDLVEALRSIDTAPAPSSSEPPAVDVEEAAAGAADAEVSASFTIPSRFTDRWLSENVPGMKRSELIELAAALRARRWTQGDIIDYAFSYGDETEVPPPRRTKGDVRDQIRRALPSRITPAWLARSVLEMSPDELATVVDELERRGWTQGEIEDHVLEAAAPDLVDPSPY